MNSSWSKNTDCECENLSHRLEYKVRVRGTLFLWGSDGIASNRTFQSPVLLHFRNDKHGEAVTFGTQVAGGNQTTIGTLQPGEFFTLEIQDIAGVFASCAEESTVFCVIKAS
jgi:hypothetical protein